MSVDKLRQNFSSKGCQIFLWIIGIAVALSMTITLLPSLFTRGMGEGEAEHAVVAEVDGRSITEEQVRGLADSFQASLGQGLDFGDPALMFQSRGLAIAAAIDATLMQTLAAKYGLDTSDAAISDFIADQLESQIEQLKLQVRLTDETLGDNTTDEQVIARIEEQLGVSLAEFKAREQERIESELADPHVREAYLAQYIASNLQEEIAESLAPSDSEVRQGATAYTYKSIYIPFGEEPDAALDKAKAAADALRAGTNADAVAQEFTGADTAPESTTTRNELVAMPGLEPLLTLEPGQVTDPIQEATGYSVYKLTAVAPVSDEDWAAQRAMLLATYRRTEANRVLEEELEALRKEVQIGWKSAGYKALYNTYQYLAENAEPEPERLRELLAEASEASADAVGVDAAALAKYAAYASLMPLLEGEAKREALEGWVETLNEVVAFTESTSLRLTLAEAYFDLDMGEEGAQELLNAAEYNSDIETIAGELAYERILAALEEALKAGNVGTEVEAEIRESLAEWKADRDEFLAEQKRIQDEIDAEQARNEAEAAAEREGQPQGE